MPEIVSAVVVAEKAVGLLGGQAFKTLMQARYEEAQAALQREMAKGKTWAITEDKAAAALFTYFRAAQEGAARANLRLVAELLFEMAQESTFAPDTFRHHAKALADLTRDELMFLADFIRCTKEIEGPAEQNAVWSRMTHPATRKLPGFVDVYALAASLGRTGWIAPLPVMDGIVYYATASFQDVVRMVDIEAAAQDEARA